MKARPIPFCGGMHKSRSPQTSSQECINWYPQLERLIDGRRQVILLPTPGTNLWKDLPNAPAEVRGSINFGGSAWVVSGNKLYEMTGGATPVATERGSLFSSAGIVSMIANRTQIAIVDGVRGYVWDAADGALSQITDPEFPAGAKTLSYAGLCAVAENPSSEILQISAINNFKDWDGLDFTAANSQPDDTVTHIADHSEVWNFGERSIQIYRYTGNADFPFEQTQNPIEFGIVGPHAKAQLDNSLFWVGAEQGSSPAVWRANGYTPVRISTGSEERMLGELERLDDLLCIAYQDDGHSFLMVTSPSGDWTIVYDVAIGQWHQRAHYDNETGEFHRHRANCYVHYDGKHLIGDFENGRLFRLDLDFYEDYLGKIKRVRSGPPVGDGRGRSFFPLFGLLIEAGVGHSEQPDPQMALRYSDDGGRTWSEPENAPLGKIGEYYAFCEWTGLGSGQNRVFEVSTTDAVKSVIRGAYL